jgi:hypothetical protein
MAAPITAAVAELKASAEVAALVSTRVYDYDVREDGPEATPEAFDPIDRTILPSISVLDGGDMRAPFGAAIGIGVVYVWTFAPRTDAGWALVPALGDLTIGVLEGWQDPVTGAMLRYAGRIGRHQLNGETRDRLTFQVSSVLPTARW